MPQPIQKKHWAGLAIGGALIGGGIIALIRNKKVIIPETDIVISNLVIGQRSAYPGDIIDVGVWAKNNGVEAQSAIISVLFGGEAMSEQTIILQPGASQQVSFQIAAPNVFGPMRVEVGGLVGVFQINNPNPATTAISGHVYNANTNQPVAGATVAILAWTSVTNSNGYFNITGIQPEFGTFPRAMEVDIVCNGYETLRQSVTIPAAGLTNLEFELAPIVVSPTEIVLSAKNLPSYLWSGSLTDISTGAIQTWGAQNGQQPARLSPLSGTLVLLEFRVMNEWMDIQGFYSYVVEVPRTVGILTWDASAKKFEGGSAGTDLLATNNKQKIRGTITSQDRDGGTISIKISESTPISGFANVGQYFIGQSVMVKYPPPVGGTGYLLSGVVEAVVMFKRIPVPIPNPPYSIDVPGWTVDGEVKAARPYPDSAYVFNANILKQYNSQGTYWADAGVNIFILEKIIINSITGTVPFKVVIGLVGQQVIEGPNGGAVAFSVSEAVRTITGPVTNYEILGSSLQSYLNLVYYTSPYDAPPFNIWANPNMGAAFNERPDLGGWVLLGSVPFYKIG